MGGSGCARCCVVTAAMSIDYSRFDGIDDEEATVAQAEVDKEQAETAALRERALRARDLHQSRLETEERFVDYGFMQKCEDKRTEGNVLVKQTKYAEVRERYKAALQDVNTLLGDPSVSLLKAKVIDVIKMWAATKLNTALCWVKEGEPGNCLQCAQEVLEGAHLPNRIQKIVNYQEEAVPRGCPLWSKAMLRTAQAHRALQNYDAAISALEEASKHCNEAFKSTVATELKSIKQERKKAFANDSKKYFGFFEKLSKEGGYVTPEEQEAERVRQESER